MRSRRRSTWALVASITALIALCGCNEKWHEPPPGDVPLIDIARWDGGALSSVTCNNPNNEACQPSPDEPAEQVIPGSYLVIARRDADLRPLREAIEALHGRVIHSFHLLNGFAVDGLSDYAVHELQRPALGVAYIEPNQRLRPSGVQTLCRDPGDPHAFSWAGLDAMDGTCDGFYGYTATGRGVHVYLMDTRVAVHPELNLGAGYSAIDQSSRQVDYLQLSPGGNPHGTLSAGIIAGRTTGVAKEAIVHPVRVLDDNAMVGAQPVADAGGGVPGSVAHSIIGWEWVAQQVSARADRAVVLMNFSVPHSSALQQAIDCAMGVTTTLCRPGVPPIPGALGPMRRVVAVAPAGNHHLSACDFDPSRNPQVLSVGALNFRSTSSARSDAGETCVQRRAEFYSNFRASLWAPGSGRSLTHDGHDVLHGTSAAAAFAAGALALRLQNGPIPASEYRLGGGHPCQAGAAPDPALPETIWVARTAATLNLLGEPEDEDGVSDGLRCRGSTCDRCPRCQSRDGCSGGIECPQGRGDCQECGEYGRSCCAGGRCTSDWQCVGGRCTGGARGQRCRPGGECDAGNLCVDDRCVACGEREGQPCCGGLCGDRLNCNGSHLCEACGVGGQPCCQSGRACNSAGLVCDAQRRCAACGGRGEPCCESGSPCNAQFTCRDHSCAPCGGTGEPCCASGRACNAGLGCGDSHTCTPCGGANERCCDESVAGCNNGLTCYQSRCQYCCFRCTGHSSHSDGGLIFYHTTVTEGGTCPGAANTFCAQPLRFRGGLQSWHWGLDCTDGPPK